MCNGDNGGDNSDCTVITTDEGSAIVSDSGEVTIEWSDGTVESYGSDDAIPENTEH